MTTQAVRHNAPAMRHGVGRRRYLGRGLWLAWALGAMASVSLAWTLAPSWRSVLILVVPPLFAWHVCSYLRKLPRGELRWTGLQWFWMDDALLAAGKGHEARAEPGQAGDIEPVWDLQVALLMRWRPSGLAAGPAGPPASRPRPARPCWLWAERGDAQACGSNWRALRRAVYSPARRDVPVAGVPEL